MLQVNKRKIVDLIKIKDKHNNVVEGHIVLILNTFLDNRIYYCSMYPGALPGYEYVSVVDLRCLYKENNGRIGTLHALNKFNDNDFEI